MGGRSGFGGGGRGNPIDAALDRLNSLEKNPATRGKYGLRRARPGRWSVVPLTVPGAFRPF